MLQRLIPLLALIVISLSLFQGGIGESSLRDVDYPSYTLYVGLSHDISTLNYFNPWLRVAKHHNLFQFLYESLYFVNPDYEIQPLLAEGYIVESANTDSLTILVNIRKNVTFHDGYPLTAKDVVFTYQVLYWDPIYRAQLECLYWKNPKWNRWDYQGRSHIGVEYVNDYMVLFHLSFNYSLFFEETLKIPIIPEHIWKDHLIYVDISDSDDMQLDYSYGKNSSEKDVTIGTGPFKFVGWESERRIVIERYNNYWGKEYKVRWESREWDLYPFYIGKIVFREYPSVDDAISALIKNEVDTLAYLSIPPQEYKDLRENPGIGNMVANDYGFYYLSFNLRKSPMADLNFRTAIVHAVDRDYILERLHGYGYEGKAPLSIVFGAFFNKSVSLPSFSMYWSMKILNNSGYLDVNGDGWRDSPDGMPIKEKILTPPTSYDSVMCDIGMMIERNLQSIGLNIVSTSMDLENLLLNAYSRANYDMYIFYWNSQSLPHIQLKELFYANYSSPNGYNSAGYNNSKVNDYLELAERNPANAKKLIMDIQGILGHELPYATLYYNKNLLVYNKGVWGGWVIAWGTHFNIFSLSSLHPESRISPSQPKYLTAQVGNDYVNLTWRWDGNLSEGIFRVYKSWDGENFKLIGDAKNPYFNDTRVSLGVKYWYYVTFYKGFRESGRSNIINATPGAPSPPINLKITYGAYFINLTWNKPVNIGAAPLKEYRIYQAKIIQNLPNVWYMKINYIGKVPATQKFFNYTEVINGRRYTFFITAVNSMGESERSNFAEVDFYIIPPVKNILVRLIKGYPYIQWEEVSLSNGFDFVRYEIYRSVDGKNFELINITTSPYYYDGSVEGGKLYYYYVRVITNHGVSEKSPIIKIYISPHIPMEDHLNEALGVFLIALLICLSALHTIRRT